MPVMLELLWHRPVGKPMHFGVSIHQAVSGQAVADAEVREQDDRTQVQLPGPGQYAVNIERRRGVFPSYRFASNRQKTIVLEVDPSTTSLSHLCELLPW
jgi:hypothetical protein